MPAARAIISLTLRAVRKYRDSGEGLTSSAPRDLRIAPSAPRELRLLPIWSNPLAEFAKNLFDVLRGRLNLFGGPRPDPSWYGAEFESPLPWRSFRASLLMHIALVGVLCAFSTWPEARVHLVRWTANDHLSPYLPELHGARIVRKHGGKSDPVRARQEIRSIPAAADNTRQTIVVPSTRKLQRAIELPNFVAVQQAPPAPPLDANAPHSLLDLPAMLPELARRVADIVQMKPQRAVFPAPEIAAVGREGAPKLTPFLPSGHHPALPMLQPQRPAPEIVQLQPQRAPSLRERTPQSAPNMGSAGHEKTDLARLVAPAGTANVPVLQRRAAEIVQQRPQRRPQASPTAGAAQAEPQPESFGSKIARSLNDLLPQRADPELPAPGMPKALALNAHPAEVPVPATPPEGNRRGAFAASPSGRENATGEPGAGSSSGIGAQDAVAKLNAPPGISVGAPPPLAASSATPGTGSSNAAAAGSETKAKLLASTRAPAMPPIRRTAPQSPVERQPGSALADLENQVFAGRRSYKMVVNMPNLNAAVGSWIIRYAERQQVAEPEPIVAPEVILKSDPAVRAELLEGGLHGTVVLTALILADGSVDQIKVVQGVFPELDQKAAEALSRWLFRPALKNGQPIEVEALVAVPIRH